MKRKSFKSAVALFSAILVMMAGPAFAEVVPLHDAASTPSPTVGPHGGSLRQVSGMQVETLVTQGGIQLFAYDLTGAPLAVDQGRGAASLRVHGNAKRYRYDLLPDGKGALAAPINLSKLGGRQIEINVQVIGTPGSNGRVAYQEIASVPLSELQLAAAAIARQQVCPVSGKPLGSMGDPVAVDVAGKRVYVCCAGCSNAVLKNPAKYAAGRPEITVASATDADAALIQRQGNCPVMDEPLGSMGKPIKVMVGDKPIFLCCRGCIKKVQAEPGKYLTMVYGKANATTTPTDAAPTDATPAAATVTLVPAGDVGVVPAGGQQVREGVFKVTADDAPFIATQKRCPVMDEPLDAMGGPFKVNADGRAVYICCPGCAKSIAKDPHKYVQQLADQGVNAPLLR